MAIFSLVRGNRLPILERTLTYANGSAVDLTDATGVTFTLLAEDGTVKVNAASATIDSAVDGEVSYAWAAADVDTAGCYIGRFDVAFPGSRGLSGPNNSEIIVVIRPRGDE